jgi:hypothetical protein
MIHKRHADDGNLQFDSSSTPGRTLSIHGSDDGHEA